MGEKPIPSKRIVPREKIDSLTLTGCLYLIRNLNCTVRTSEDRVVRGTAKIRGVSTREQRQETFFVPAIRTIKGNKGGSRVESNGEREGKRKETKEKFGKN